MKFLNTKIFLFFLRKDLTNSKTSVIINNVIKRLQKIKNLKEVKIMKTYLMPKYDTRKSFYNKAVVEHTNNKATLYSYNTKVAEIENGKVKLFNAWDYSSTTLRHTKEFLKQNGFAADTKAQMQKEYL